MSSSSVRAVAFVCVLLMASLAPLATPAAAHSAILLDVDTHHVVLEPGQSTNVTLSIENNGSSIESYEVAVDTGTLVRFGPSTPPMLLSTMYSQPGQETPPL